VVVQSEPDCWQDIEYSVRDHAHGRYNLPLTDGEDGEGEVRISVQQVDPHLETVFTDVDVVDEARTVPP
jgi:hypothetical protein